MSKKSISLRLDSNILETVDEYAESRRMSRTEAITDMLCSTKVVILKEGAEIMSHLYSLDMKLSRIPISVWDLREVEEVCDAVWQLLSSITVEIQEAAEETN